MNEKRIKQTQLLKSQGMLVKDIAEALGVSVGTVYLDLNPEAYEKALSDNRIRNKLKYCKKDKCPIPDCDNSKLVSSKYCKQCAYKYNPYFNKVWTKESIIAAIKEFYNVYDRIPTSIELRTKDKRHDVVMPSYKSVRNVFGRWNRAVEAAGLTPRKSTSKKYQ